MVVEEIEKNAGGALLPKRGHGRTRATLFFALLDMCDTSSANNIAHGPRQHHRNTRLNFWWTTLHCGILIGSNNFLIHQHLRMSSDVLGSWDIAV